MTSIEYKKLSSAVLWKLSVDDDKKAFETLFKREFKGLKDYGVKIFNVKANIPDAIQDLFCDLWVNRKNRSNIKNIKFYLLKALRFKAIKVNRDANIIDISTISIESPGIDNDINSQELSKVKMKRALAQLPKNQQETLHLKYYHGMSNNEISDLLDIKYQSVSNCLHRGISALRSTLKKKISTN